MSIEFKEENYYCDMWFFPMKPGIAGGKNGGDWMGCLYKEPDGKWIFKYRFRYYEGDDPSPFNDPDDPCSTIDRKSWYTCTMKDVKDGEEKELLNKTQEGIKEMATLAGSTVDFLDLHCMGGLELARKLQDANKPWLHCKRLKEIDSDNFAV